MTNDPTHLWPGVGHGLEVIHRCCIVRLGSGGPELYYPTNHGSLGFLSVCDTGDGYLTVYSDFDGSQETCVHASADVHLTLARKQVTTGASGGASMTKYGLYSPRYGTSAFRRTANRVRAALGADLPRIPPGDSFFNLAADNLWIHHVSVRPIPEAG